MKYDAKIIVALLIMMKNGGEFVSIATANPEIANSYCWQ
jgi:hypothetical protein